MPEDTPTTRNSSRWFLPIFTFVLIAGVVGGAFWVRGKRLPGLDQARFEASQAQWEQNRLADYEIAITVRGRQPGIYAVQVQHGIAVTATLDGRDLKRPRTFGTWSVDGMFETILRDLENHEIHGHLRLGAEFDPTYGFPARYQRMEMQSGMHDALQWEVTRFVVP